MRVEYELPPASICTAQEDSVTLSHVTGAPKPGGERVKISDTIAPR
jgi:hypothetical protein